MLCFSTNLKFNNQRIKMGDALFENISGQKAIFGMACFWQADAAFGCFPGAIRVQVGYCGGTPPDPTSKRIGDYLEAVEVEYDPLKVSFNDLLVHFWNNHDPSSCEKPQHRSTIFYTNHDEKAMAEEFLNTKQGKEGVAVTTQILPAPKFFPAEDYHQKHALQQYPAIVNGLKIAQNQYHKSHVATRLNGYIAGYGTMESFDAELKQLGLSKEVEKHVRDLIEKHKKQAGAAGSKKGTICENVQKEPEPVAPAKSAPAHPESVPAPENEPRDRIHSKM